MLRLTPFITAYCCILAAVLGACMGSFFNCAAWRFVRGESVVRGRSRCDACGHVLTARDLVPVFSFLLSRGRCRWCGAKLSARHLLAELVSAAVFVTLLLKYDISLHVLEAYVIASLLMLCALTDLEGYIIPDRFLIAAAAVRLVWLLMQPERLRLCLWALLGGVSVAGVLLLGVVIAEKRSGKELMGGGDIKLLFVTGLCLGWQKNILCLLLACLLGILTGLPRRRADGAEASARIPWGPSIVLALWLCTLFGDAVLGAYLGLF